MIKTWNQFLADFGWGRFQNHKKIAINNPAIVNRNATNRIVDEYWRPILPIAKADPIKAVVNTTNKPYIYLFMQTHPIIYHTINSSISYCNEMLNICLTFERFENTS